MISVPWTWLGDIPNIAVSDTCYSCATCGIENMLSIAESKDVALSADNTVRVIVQCAMQDGGSAGLDGDYIIG